MRAPRPILALVSLLAPLLPTLTAAQEDPGVLSAVVVDHVTAAPVLGATVVLPELGIGGVTDAAGRVRLRAIPPGRHRVEVRMLGYATERLEVEFEPAARVSAEIGLLLAPVEIEAVRAVAERQAPALQGRGFYQRRKFGFGSFLTRAEIERWGRHTGRVTDALRQVPGLSLRPSPTGTGYVVTSTRGRCAADVFVDGTHLRGIPDVAVSPEPSADRRGGAGQSSALSTGTGGPLQITSSRGQPVPIDQIVSAGELEGIEWYSGPATTPPEFRRPQSHGSDPRCGTLVLWTRTGR